VAANLADLDYAKKRLALEAPGVQVRVWRAGHSPRFQITLDIPLEGDAEDAHIVSGLTRRRGRLTLIERRSARPDRRAL